jgi:hypothetical protein
MPNETSIPILFVGAPRSGTTIIFEQYALHPDLAWVLNYARVFPRAPSVNLLRRVVDNRWLSLRGAKNQFGDLGLINKYLPRPDESYEFWTAHSNGEFARGYLLDQEATAQEASQLRQVVDATRRYQGRPRVTAKLTGPGRIGYLASVWPDVRIVHVIRDGLGVVKSLLNARFWKANGGFDKPWWSGGLQQTDLDCWDNHDRDPGVLAALQWRRIVETTRDEARRLNEGHYTEVRYEDFTTDPAAAIERVYRTTELDSECDPVIDLAPRNQKYQDDWDDAYRERLIECMQPLYGELGYRAPAEPGKD